jgi:hypothetical protein
MSKVLQDKPILSFVFIRTIQTLIFSFLIIISLFIVTSFIVPAIVVSNNNKIMSQYTFGETEDLKVYDTIENWRTTFDGGSQLLDIYINTLTIREYNSKTDQKITSCANRNYSKQPNSNDTKVIDVFYTDIWYFGIPLKTPRVICTY